MFLFLSLLFTYNSFTRFYLVILFIYVYFIYFHFIIFKGQVSIVIYKLTSYVSLTLLRFGTCYSVDQSPAGKLFDRILLHRYGLQLPSQILIIVFLWVEYTEYDDDDRTLKIKTRIISLGKINTCLMLSFSHPSILFLLILKNIKFFKTT